MTPEQEIKQLKEDVRELESHIDSIYEMIDKLVDKKFKLPRFPSFKIKNYHLGANNK